jgi:CRISPR-associated Csx2 family protein
MSKILVSFIGTGAFSTHNNSPIREYRKAKYSIEGDILGESPFVSSILYDYLGIDSLILIGTAKSMWEEVYRYYSEKNNIPFNEDFYFNLGDKVEAADHTSALSDIDLQELDSVLGGKSKTVLIPYGLNYKEQIIIFKKVADALSHLDDGDEIILDITHSFRSLPLFSTSVINYIQEVHGKKILFNRVFYGMLDAIREFDNVAPIVEISSALELNKWTTAAHSFKEYGKGYLLAELLGEEEGKMIKIFSDAVNINYLNEIQSKLTNFKTFANSEIQNEFGKMVVPSILNSFVSRLHKAGNKHYLFQLELARWHYDRKNYASAFIVFMESIITYVCEKNQRKWSQMDNREDAKKRILTENAYNLRGIYSNARDIRNNIAHNLSKRGTKVEGDIMSFKKSVDQFVKISNSN